MSNDSISSFSFESSHKISHKPFLLSFRTYFSFQESLFFNSELPREINIKDIQPWLKLTKALPKVLQQRISNIFTSKNSFTKSPKTPKITLKRKVQIFLISQISVQELQDNNHSLPYLLRSSQIYNKISIIFSEKKAYPEKSKANFFNFNSP